MGVLNWIADNPVKSSLMSMPAMYGIGAGANKLGAAKTAAYLTGWKAVIPAMIDAGGGTIITVSSMAALRPGLLGGAPYSAAKAGVTNLMGDINAEFSNQGIRATAVMPAEVNTPILENRPLPPSEEARSSMMGAEDLADVIFLCAALPHRTTIDQVVLSPTTKRDTSADLAAAAAAGG